MRMLDALYVFMRTPASYLSLCYVGSEGRRKRRLLYRKSCESWLLQFLAETPTGGESDLGRQEKSNTQCLRAQAWSPRTEDRSLALLTTCSGFLWLLCPPRSVFSEEMSATSLTPDVGRTVLPLDVGRFWSLFLSVPGGYQCFLATGHITLSFHRQHL